MAGEQSPLQRGVAELLARPPAVFGLSLLAIMIAAALLAPLVSSQNPYDPAQLYPLDARLPPGSASAAGTPYWLGTDDRGRDMLSAILHGLRISMLVGAASAVIALAIGLAIGFSAVYLHAVDSAIMRVADIELSFPAVLILIIAVAFLGYGLVSLIVALILMQWAYYARIVRGVVWRERRKPYVEAARCLA